MEIINNYSLKALNSFHLDGNAKTFYKPENEKELINLLGKLKSKKYYILSAGSNILLNDNIEYDNVIYMADVDNEIKQLDDNGSFYIGASNRLQKVINRINELGYGGIERMYTIPAFFGGAIYMNAGIGSKKNPAVTISEFITRVKVISKDKNVIEWIEKEDCHFGHRKSVFQNDKYVILGAECVFRKQDIEISKKIIKERIDSFRKHAEMGKGTFGTIFSESTGKLLKLNSLIYAKKGGVHFGKNNKNWLVNNGNGTFNDAMFLINKAQLIHKLFHRKIECEVRIWR